MQTSSQNKPPATRPLLDDLRDPQFWLGLLTLGAVIAFTFVLLTVLGGAQ